MISNPTPIHFHCSIVSLSELSNNCTMAWVAGRLLRAILYVILYATLAVILRFGCRLAGKENTELIARCLDGSLYYPDDFPCTVLLFN